MLPGDVADPADLPPGCLFHPRCPYAQPICAAEEPPLVDVGDGEGQQHPVACHFADPPDLTGIERGAGRAAFRLEGAAAAGVRGERGATPATTED